VRWSVSAAVKPDAQNELARTEGFGHVIVGPNLQTVNPLAGFTSGRQDDNGKRRGVGVIL